MIYTREEKKKELLKFRLELNSDLIFIELFPKFEQILADRYEKVRISFGTIRTNSINIYLKLPVTIKELSLLEKHVIL